MEGIYTHADLIKVYKAILDATQEIGTYLRYHSGKCLQLVYDSINYILLIAHLLIT